MLTISIIAACVLATLFLIKVGAKRLFRSAGAQYERRRAIEYETRENGPLVVSCGSQH